MTSSDVITEKNEKQYVSQRGILHTVTSDDFTDKPEFQCDVHVVKNASLGDSK